MNITLLQRYTKEANTISQEVDFISKRTRLLADKPHPLTRIEKIELESLIYRATQNCAASHILRIQISSYLKDKV